LAKEKISTIEEYLGSLLAVNSMFKQPIIVPRVEEVTEQSDDDVVVVNNENNNTTAKKRTFSDLNDDNETNHLDESNPNQRIKKPRLNNTDDDQSSQNTWKSMEK
jgi:hypothetical protein